MLSFAAEFPVANAADVTSVANAVKDWILGSRYCTLLNSDFDGVLDKRRFLAQRSSQKFESLSLANAEANVFAGKFSTKSDGADWITEVVFSKNGAESWVSIRTSRESDKPVAYLPEAKKPIIVKILLEKIGGGSDGDLTVSDKPHWLGVDDIDFASSLINGTSGVYLPVIYVSHRFDGGYTVDPYYIAEKLGGLAHVICEPSRRFSNELRVRTDARNVYGGSVGIYWPKGSGRRALYVGNTIDTPAELVEVAVDEVRGALLNRRPLGSCTWSHVEEIVSRSEIDELKSAGSKDIEQYTRAFDAENRALKDKLSEAEQEIDRLKLANSSAKSGLGQNVIQLSCGTEQDLSENEILEIVIDCIQNQSNNVQSGSRRQHVLKSIVKSNTVNQSLNRKRDDLKSCLKGYRSMTTEVRRSLESLGFSISEDGKHHKLIYRDDDRYTFALPKSGSDHRGGLNAYSDISKHTF